MLKKGVYARRNVDTGGALTLLLFCGQIPITNGVMALIDGTCLLSRERYYCIDPVYSKALRHEKRGLPSPYQEHNN